VPDVVVEDVELRKTDVNRTVKERDLSGHLTNGPEDEKLDAELADASKGLAERDYQVYEALNLLKALSIVGKAKK
jgi:carboxyl-terminal processing protease